MILKEKKDYINMIFLFILLVPFFKPDIVVSFPKMNYLYSIYLFFSVAYIGFKYIKSKKISVFFIAYAIFFFINILSTIINNGNILKALYDFALNFGIIMLIELYCHKDITKLFRIMIIIFYVLTIANTLSFIIFPDGFSKSELMKTPIYLLGIDNRFAFTYLPGVCIISIYELLVKNKLGKLTYIYLAITYGTFIYFWSAGALVAETLMVIYYVLLYRFRSISPTKYLYISLAGFVSLVFLRMQNLFKFLIVDVLHKDLTLSDRTILWDNSIKFIKTNPILGIGIQKTKIMLNKISAYHAHCYYLNTILQSGIIGFISFIILIYISLRELAKYRDSLISKIVSFTIFTLLIMLLVDTFDITCNFVLLLSIGYSVGYIIKGGEVNAK